MDNNKLYIKKSTKSDKWILILENKTFGVRFYNSHSSYQNAKSNFDGIQDIVQEFNDKDEDWCINSREYQAPNGKYWKHVF